MSSSCSKRNIWYAIVRLASTISNTLLSHDTLLNTSWHQICLIFNWSFFTWSQIVMPFLSVSACPRHSPISDSKQAFSKLFCLLTQALTQRIFHKQVFFSFKFRYRSLFRHRISWRHFVAEDLGDSLKLPHTFLANPNNVGCSLSDVLFTVVLRVAHYSCSV